MNFSLYMNQIKKWYEEFFCLKKFLKSKWDLSSLDGSTLFVMKILQIFLLTFIIDRWRYKGGTKKKFQSWFLKSYIWSRLFKARLTSYCHFLQKKKKILNSHSYEMIRKNKENSMNKNHHHFGTRIFFKAIQRGQSSITKVLICKWKSNIA